MLSFLAARTEPLEKNIVNSKTVCPATCKHFRVLLINIFIFIFKEKLQLFVKKIKEFKEKYPDQNNVPRPSYWSGWLLKPYKIEFWMDVENRLHQRLCYAKIGNAWHQEILYP